jgi:hypothetical protein
MKECPSAAMCPQWGQRAHRLILPNTFSKQHKQQMNVSTLINFTKYMPT